MEHLRSEIRAAFEQEQAAHPPISALRQNVVASVTAHSRRDTNYQWLAVAAAPATATGAPNAIAAPPKIGPLRTRMPCVANVYAPMTRPRSSLGADSWIFVFVRDCVSTAVAASPAC